MRRMATAAAAHVVIAHGPRSAHRLHGPSSLLLLLGIGTYFNISQCMLYVCICVVVAVVGVVGEVDGTPTIAARTKIKNKFMRFYLCAARRNFAKPYATSFNENGFLFRRTSSLRCHSLHTCDGTAKTFQHYSSDDVRCPAIHCINFVVFASTDIRCIRCGPLTEIPFMGH